MLKRTLTLSGIALFCILGVLVFQNYPKLEVVSGYAAKKMCSCTFISGRDQASIQSEDLHTSPLSLSKTKIDLAKKSVTSSIFGLQSKTAEFRGNLGCILIHGKDDYHVKYPSNSIDLKPSSSLPFPYGDKVDIQPIQNVDYEKLEAAANYAFDPDGLLTKMKTRSILVLHKDSIILEKYAKGYDAGTALLGWSMTKSIMNTWIGMMVQDGLINISDKSLFDEWMNDERKNITLNDLLQMSSGLEWNEIYSEVSPATKMLYGSENNAKYATKQPLKHSIGDFWQYSSGTSNIISGYLRNQYKSHNDYLRFPYERIFSKLNMTNTIIETDESGTFIGSSYCYATTRDWARFGTLYLRDGVWNGERLLPEGWVTYTKTSAPNSGGIYGAHFWLNEDGNAFKDCPSDMFSANGYEGQRVFIIPSKDLVIVRMGLGEAIDFNKLVKGICDAIE